MSVWQLTCMLLFQPLYVYTIEAEIVPLLYGVPWNIVHFFLCPTFPLAVCPQLEWAVCSSPWTFQDGNLFLHCFVNSGELLQAILSSAGRRGRQKNYFQGSPLTVYVGVQRLTLGLWSPEAALWASRGVTSPQPYLWFNSILKLWTLPLFRAMGLRIRSIMCPLPSRQ